MCSPHGDVFCCLRTDLSYSKTILGREIFTRFHRLLYWLEKSSRQNGISHPYWVKIWDKTTIVKLIYVPNKNSKFFLLQYHISDCTVASLVCEHLQGVSLQWLYVVCNQFGSLSFFSENLITSISFLIPALYWTELCLHVLSFFRLLLFNSTSTFLGYLMPNPFF